MARNTAALRRPPEKELPSTPAGVYVDDATELLGVVVEHERRRGRGAQSNASGRYEPLARIAFDDGWRSLDELPPFKTTVATDATRKIITRNDSPDIGFDRSINPYRGCEHGCVYCFARPTHAYLGLSPGLDFESKLFVKPEAAELLERELSAPGYSPKVIAIGTNTRDRTGGELSHGVPLAGRQDAYPAMFGRARAVSPEPIAQDWLAIGPRRPRSGHSQLPSPGVIRKISACPGGP